MSFLTTLQIHSLVILYVLCRSLLQPVLRLHELKPKSNYTSLGHKDRLRFEVQNLLMSLTKSVVIISMSLCLNFRIA